MGQRVNIHYSVQLEDLQEEVNRLFSNAISKFDTIIPVGERPVANLGTDGLDEIDRIRVELNKVDIMLGDIQKIVEGYIRFKTTPRPPKQEKPTEPQTHQETQVEQDAEIDDLEQKILKFKEMIGEVANKESDEENE